MKNLLSRFLFGLAQMLILIFIGILFFDKTMIWQFVVLVIVFELYAWLRKKESEYL